MSVQTIVTCNRCRQVIEADRHCFDFLCGSLRGRFDGSDFCRDCVMSLMAFLGLVEDPSTPEPEPRG